MSKRTSNTGTNSKNKKNKNDSKAEEAAFLKRNDPAEALKIYGGIIIYFLFSYFMFRHVEPPGEPSPKNMSWFYRPFPEWIKIAIVTINAYCINLRNEYPIHTRESRIAIILACAADLFMRLVWWKFGEYKHYTMGLHAIYFFPFFMVGVLGKLANSGNPRTARFEDRMLMVPAVLGSSMIWASYLPRIICVADCAMPTSRTIHDILLRYTYTFIMGSTGSISGMLIAKTLIGKSAWAEQKAKTE